MLSVVYGCFDRITLCSSAVSINLHSNQYQVTFQTKVPMFLSLKVQAHFLSLSSLFLWYSQSQCSTEPYVLLL